MSPVRTADANANVTVDRLAVPRGGTGRHGVDGMRLYIAFLVSLLTFGVSRSGAMSHKHSFGGL